LWAATVTGLGYAFAGSVGALLDVLHRAQLAMGIGLGAVLIVFVAVRRRRVRA
jgi:membrane protein DedA with SNARE-associated domain